MPLVSIIVPVYNRQRSVMFCLQSLAAMHCSDCEVLIVDDGSTDASGHLCRGFCDMHHNFRYIRQTNGGVSSARNHGLREAGGEWITFVDADDAVRPEHLDMLARESAVGADIVVQAFEMVGSVDDGYRVDSLVDAFDVRHESSEPVHYMFADYDPYRNPLFSTCNKFFKRSVCTRYGITFDEGLSLDEDQLFVSRYLSHAARVVCYPDARTYLFLDWGGQHLSGVVHLPETFLAGFDANMEAFCGLRQRGGSAVDRYANHYYINGIVRRIVLNYTSRRLSKILQRGELHRFVAEELRPRFANLPAAGTLDWKTRMLFILIRNDYVTIALCLGSIINTCKSLMFRLRRIS